MMDDITQASHIVAGMGVTFDEAMAMVRAAQEFAERDERMAPATPTVVENVMYGVDFYRR